MTTSDLVKDPSRLMTALDFEVRIGGKMVGLVQNFTIKTGLEGDLFVNFDAECLRILPEQDGSRLAAFALGLSDEIEKYKMSDEIAKRGGKYIVRSMETNKNTGRVIINLFELRTEKGEES